MQKKSNKSSFEIPEIYSTMTFPSAIEESVIENNKKSIFSIYPIKKGFSVTIANSLRRVLLSSIYGTCITALKVSGVSHQFSFINGIKEDVTTIISNLKEILIHTDNPIVGEKRLSFIVSKKGLFSFSNISIPSDIKILNPEKVLFEVVEDIKIEFEIFLTSGFGYKKNNNKEDEKDISLIPIEAYYSPVTNVSYKIEEKIVDETSDNEERLILEIETNNTIKPIEALKIAAFLTRQHFKFIIDFDEIDLFQKEEIKLNINPYLIKKVTELELSVRASNCLRNENIMYVGELIQYSESDLIKTPNFGKKSLDEIKEVLESIGLSLGTPVENWMEIKENYLSNS